MSLGDRIYVLRISGVVDASGVLVAYTTGTLPYGDSAVSIAALPALLSQRVGVLDTLGSDGGVSVTLVPGAPQVYQVLRQTVSLVRTVGGGVCRMVRPPGTGGTIYTTGEPDLSVNDVFFVGGEAMRYDGGWTASSSWFGGAGTIDVTRGRYGTVTTQVGVSGAGSVMLNYLPTLVGQRAVLSYAEPDTASSGAETVIYRGFVDAISTSGEVTLSGAISRVRDRQYVPVRSAGSPLAQEITWRSSDDGLRPTSALALADVVVDALPEDVSGTPLLWIDALPEDVSGTPLLWIDAQRDGVSASILTAGAWTDRYVGGVHEQVVSVTSTSEALLMLVDGQQYTADEAAIALAYPWTIRAVTLADNLGAGGLYDVISVLLRGENGPVGRRCGLTVSDIDVTGLLRLDDAAGVTSVATTCYDGTARFVLPPVERPTSMRSILADLLAPWGVTLASASDGRITAIDWLQPRSASVAVGDSDLRAPLTATSSGTRSAIRAVTINAVGVGEAVQRTYVSDVVAQFAQGGEHMQIDAGVWGPLWPQIASRWVSLLSEYQLSAPTTRITVSPSVDAEVGEWLSLTCSTLIGPDGTRGVSNVECIVTSRGESLTAPTVDLDVVLVGWGRDANARPWAPAGRVVSVTQDGGSDLLTLGTYFDAGGEAANFVVGDFVLLYDQWGRTIDATPREVTDVTGSVVTCDGFGTTPVATDMIVPADYDDTPNTVWAWMAAPDGTLGAAGDDGHTWR